MDDIPCHERRWVSGVQRERGDKMTNATDEGAVGGRRAIVRYIKPNETGGAGRARISCNASNIFLRL